MLTLVNRNKRLHRLMPMLTLTLKQTKLLHLLTRNQRKYLQSLKQKQLLRHWLTQRLKRPRRQSKRLKQKHRKKLRPRLLRMQRVKLRLRQRLRPKRRQMQRPLKQQKKMSITTCLTNPLVPSTLLSQWALP